MKIQNNSYAIRMKMIDKIISAYKAKKLEIEAQQERANSNKNEEICYEGLKDRMNKAYQNKQRQKKIDKLNRIQKHWKGLS